ncbi:MAG TPA: type II toxin-antitoxin system VapC family toxin [Rhizomicrobium sp.]|nr:type II toxin-antitoxin system VapC family toxin [Rhizomicrobium sp.]
MSAPLVVDASAVVQLLLAEPDTEPVDAYLLHDPRWSSLIAPSILVSETAAAITKKVRRKDITSVSAREAFRDWQDMLASDVFALIPANDLIDAAFELSLKLHHPLHDCLYLALAKDREAAIATRDTVLARKAREMGFQAELIGA